MVEYLQSSATFWVYCSITFSFNARDEYYAWGLNQIAKAVSFLNNDCKLVSIEPQFYPHE